MPPVKVRKVGNSLAILLTVPMAQKLRVKEGDLVYATETPNGLGLTTYDPDVEEQIELGREFMKDYQETFAALAK